MPFQKGHKINLGRKLSKKHKNNLSESHKGYKMPESQKRKISKSNKGRKVLKRTREKIRNAQKGKPRLWLRGKKHYLWKGNQKINRKIRDCWKYQQWRSDIFKRDNWTCQTCQKRGCYLEAHHIKEMSKIIEENKIKTLKQALNCDELWNLDNGVTLCRECHDLTKKGRKKVCGSV